MRVFLLAALLLALPLAAQPGERPMGPPPGGPPGPDRGFLWGQMLRAIEEKSDLLLEEGKTDAALETLQRVFAVDVPKWHPAFEMKTHLVGKLAVVYMKAGKKKEAVETVQKLLAEVPPDTPAEAAALVDAGAVYRQAGMADEALKAFDRAIALAEKLAKAAPRGPAGRPMPPPGGRPPGFRPPPKGEPDK
jgi:tetratricopeptide (TPR) repeat protein